jgi:hypothetical protein
MLRTERPHLAMFAFSQPGRTTRYVRYVSSGELSNAAPTTSRLYVATIVHCVGEYCSESETKQGDRRVRIARTTPEGMPTINARPKCPVEQVVDLRKMCSLERDVVDWSCYLVRLLRIWTE